MHVPNSKYPISETFHINFVQAHRFTEKSERDYYKVPDGTECVLFFSKQTIDLDLYTSSSKAIGINSKSNVSFSRLLRTILTSSMALVFRCLMMNLENEAPA